MITGPVNLPDPHGVDITRVETGVEMHSQVMNVCKEMKIDLFIAAAAVAVADAVQGVPRPRPIQRAEEGPARNARSPAARFRGGCQKQQRPRAARSRGRRSESARPGPAPRQGIRPGPRWIRETRERRSAVGQASSSQAPGRSRHGGRGRAACVQATAVVMVDGLRFAPYCMSR